MRQAAETGKAQLSGKVTLMQKRQARRRQAC
jgi:hypothetical protein